MNPAIDFPAIATRRLPAWALGLSLAVHLAVLAGPFLPRPAADQVLPPLVVNFRLPAPVAAPAPASIIQAAPAVAARKTAAVAARDKAPLPKPAVLAVAGPAPTIAAVSAAAPSTTAPPAPPSERSETPPPARAAEASPPPVAPPDPAAMARYIRLLGDLLAQQQQYPRLAAMRGWEGEVRLRLQMARKGTIIAVRVVHSSGFEVLDQHAVQLVQSATLPPPPAAYFSTAAPDGASPDFQIDIPIHYSLKRS